MNSNRYEKNYQIPSIFVGGDQQVRFSSLTLITQELGAEHSQQVGVSGPQLAPQGVAWMVVRSRLEVIRYPELEEQITLATWVREPKGFFIPREVEGRDTAGNLLFQGCTFWVPVHMETKKPQRAVHFTGGVQPISKEDELPVTPTKISALNEEHSTNLELPVMVRDIDANAHVNNGVYIDWIVESITRKFSKEYKLADVTMNYLLEIPEGEDSVEIRTVQLDKNSYLHSFCKPHGTIEYARAKTLWS